MNILITGGSGLLGSTFAEHFEKNNNVIAADLSNRIEFKKALQAKLDITKKEDFPSIKPNPKIIIHCAGIVGISPCENNPAMAHEVNVLGTKNVIEYAKKIGAKVIYISTDYVFDGKKGNYSEMDIPSPLSVYGKTKLESEKYLRKSDLIVRTSFYGLGKEPQKGFLNWILNSIKNSEKISLYDNQYNTMVYSKTLVNIVDQMIKKGLTGLYNIGAGSKFSKYEFGKHLAEELNLDFSNVSASSLPKDDKLRPLDTSLSTEKLSKIDIKIPKLIDDIKNLKGDINADT